MKPTGNRSRALQEHDLELPLFILPLPRADDGQIFREYILAGYEILRSFVHLNARGRTKATNQKANNRSTKGQHSVQSKFGDFDPCIIYQSYKRQ